jgi:hypothetical protein
MAIRTEEKLASADHTVAEIDQWESAHFAEDVERLGLTPGLDLFALVESMSIEVLPG